MHYLNEDAAGRWFVEAARSRDVAHEVPARSKFHRKIEIFRII
jgi:hypothetical protein